MIAFTRTPAGPHSIARQRVSMSTPAFAAQTWLCIAIGRNACGAEMLITTAPGLRSSSNAARAAWKLPSRSISTTALKPRLLIPIAGAGKLPAAPQTRMSSGPCAATAAWSAFSTAS